MNTYSVALDHHSVISFILLNMPVYAPAHLIADALSLFLPTLLLNCHLALILHCSVYIAITSLDISALGSDGSILGEEMDLISKETHV